MEGNMKFILFLLLVVSTTQSFAMSRQKLAPYMGHFSKKYECIAEEIRERRGDRYISKVNFGTLKMESAIDFVLVAVNVQTKHYELSIGKEELQDEYDETRIANVSFEDGKLKLTAAIADNYDQGWTFLMGEDGKLEVSHFNISPPAAGTAYVEAYKCKVKRK